MNHRTRVIMTAKAKISHSICPLMSLSFIDFGWGLGYLDFTFWNFFDKDVL